MIRDTRSLDKRGLAGDVLRPEVAVNDHVRLPSVVTCNNVKFVVDLLPGDCWGFSGASLDLHRTFICFCVNLVIGSRLSYQDNVAVLCGACGDVVQAPLKLMWTMASSR